MSGTLTFDTSNTNEPKFILQWNQNVNYLVSHLNPGNLIFSTNQQGVPGFLDYSYALINSIQLYVSGDNGNNWIPENDPYLIINNNKTLAGFNIILSTNFMNPGYTFTQGFTYKFEITFMNVVGSQIFNTGQEYQTQMTSMVNINTMPGPTLTPIYLEATQPYQFFCLFEDTEVLTPSGYVSVKSLQEGDLVTTSDGRASHIKRIWSSYMPLQEQFLPIIISANSITENYPPQDCRLSKYHLINFNGNWITPYKNEHIFKYDREVKSIKYYHLELENYFTDNLVINGGLVVESLGNCEKDNSAEWEDRVNNSIIL